MDGDGGGVKSAGSVNGGGFLSVGTPLQGSGSGEEGLVGSWRPSSTGAAGFNPRAIVQINPRFEDQMLGEELSHCDSRL